MISARTLRAPQRAQGNKNKPDTIKPLVGDRKSLSNQVSFCNENNLIKKQPSVKKKSPAEGDVLNFYAMGSRFSGGAEKGIQRSSKGAFRDRGGVA